MYEKTTKKIVEALLKTPEGYQCLNSLVDRYICCEREDLLPDVEMPVSDMKIQCFKETLCLKLLGSKLPVNENRGYFTFAFSGAFMQNVVYFNQVPLSYGEWYSTDSDSLDVYIDLLENEKEDLQRATELRDEQAIKRIENYIRQLENTIKARTADFNLYLNITFTIEGNHHLQFDKLYLSHTENGEYITDGEHNIQYGKRLTDVFSETAEGILSIELKDMEANTDPEADTNPKTDSDMEPDAGNETETEIIFDYISCKKMSTKLVSWFSYGKGRYLLNYEFDKYLHKYRPELLPFGEYGQVDDDSSSAEFHAAEFYPKNNTFRFALTKKLYYYFDYIEDYSVDDGQVTRKREECTVDDITVNVSFEVMPDGCHIIFDQFYLSDQYSKGDIRSLKVYLPNEEAVRRILMGELREPVKETKMKIEKAEKIISDTLSRYAIKDKEDVLLNFFRFKIHKDATRRDIDVQGTRFNLLININNTVRMMKCLQTVFRQLSLSKEKIVYCQERSLLEVFKKNEIEEGYKAILDVFLKYELVVIIDCQEPEEKMADASSQEKDSLTENAMIHKLAWKHIAEAAKQSGAARLIIIANDAVYRKKFRRNLEIYDQLCRHHLEIPDLSPEEVYNMCLERVKVSGFKLTEVTEEKLHEFILETYSRSEVREEEFVDNLFNNQIFADWLSQGCDSNSLEPNLIPEIKLRDSEDVFRKLDELVGLGQVKKELRSIYDRRVALGVEDKELEHMCFVGNPGTGKTTVAKLLADMLYDMRLINKNVLVCKKATDLFAGYLGQTAEKTTNIIKEAYGGVLFIDEAYGLARSENLYAQEALDVLIQEMEDADNPERPVVILAGYEKEMRELRAANPGLESRIKRFVHFEDYNEDELFEILCGMLEKKQFRLDVPEECVEKFRNEGFKLDYLPTELSGLRDLIKEKKSKEFFGNAREMRTLCDELIERWAAAWAENKRNAENVSDESSREKVITKDYIDSLKAKTKDGIKELIGLTDLKEKLDEFEARVKYAAELRRNGTYIPDSNMHMLFVGNPGTGKTTVAKRLADKLCRIGVLPTNKCIVVESKDLVRYQNQKTPAQITEDFIKRAIGGILFVDEAYTLVTPEGLKVIEVLLTAMEEHKDDTIFIFAGYPKEMDDFLSTNPGLKSRIANRFEFPDYKPAELIEILYLEMKRTGETEDKRLRFADNDKAIEKLMEILEMFSAMPDFGNGRFVGSLFRQIIDKHAARYKEGNQEDIRTLMTEDIPTIQELLRVSYGKEGIADPEKIKGEILNRVARHEMGHAVVSMETDGDTPIEKISVRGAYGSYGRVSYHPDGESLHTEQELKNRLASLLGGRNAERVFFGDSSAGCASDYERAKNLVKMMIEHWAMGELGISKEMDFLREADARATKILYDNRDFIDAVASKLVEVGEISGEQIKKLYRIYKDDGLQSLNNEIKEMKTTEGTNALEKIKKTLVDKGLL